VLLGATFTCVQAYEYRTPPSPSAANLRRTFFMATGFHGAHVLIARSSCWSAWCARSRHFTPTQHLGSNSPPVLAFRRRGLAVPVRLHLWWGAAPWRARTLTAAVLREGARHAPPFVLVRSSMMTPVSPLHCRSVEGCVPLPRCGEGHLFQGF